jgi:hypothetical protein
MSITMADSALNVAFPGSLAAYAAYVDGGIGDQPNYDYVVAAFPHAHHLSIALFASHDADALDVELGAARPGDVAMWYARQKARGIARPCLYASASTMEFLIVPAIRAAHIARAEVRLWSAHYGEGEHICGPGTCEAVSIDADGTQWTNQAPGANGGVIDLSILRDDFFGAVSNVTDIPLDIRGSYTDGAGALYVIGIRKDGVLCESKRTATGVWDGPYPIAGKTGA